jgi:hypothetical protein
MPKFVINRPVESDVPVVEVAAGLKAGVHTFELVVIDDKGNESRPVQAQVTVLPGRLGRPLDRRPQ